MKGLFTGRRTLGPGIVLFFSMGAVILASALLNAYGHSQDVFDEASDFIYANLHDRLSMVSAAQMSFEAFFASSREVERGEFALYCEKVRKNWPFLRSIEYYAPSAEGAERLEAPLYAYPESSPRRSRPSFPNCESERSFAEYEQATGELVFLSCPLSRSLLVIRIPVAQFPGSLFSHIPVAVTLGLSGTDEGATRPVFAYGSFVSALLPFMELRRESSMEALGREWVVATRSSWRLAFHDAAFMGATAAIGLVFLLLGSILLRRSRELRRREELLMRAERMETATSLASGIAHDFNNALTGIVGTLDLLRGILGKDEYVQRARLEKPLSIMEEAAARAGEMVASLRQVGNESGRPMERVDLCVCAKAVVELARNAVDARVSIEFADRTGGSAPCLGDRSLLERAFMNLIVNASHSMTIMMPAGRTRGGTVQVALEEYRAGSRFRGKFRFAGTPRVFWQLTVKDTGVGIDHANRSRIFMPYYSTKSDGKSSGLGLSMVYSVMRSHEGYVDLESRPGKGTTFFLYFPAPEG